MIWLFPENEIPITAANILKCLDFADDRSREYIGPGNVDGIGTSGGTNARPRVEGNDNADHERVQTSSGGDRMGIEPASCDVTPPIEYFSCVPYVLNIIAQTQAGQVRLQSMELVGIGGTALSQADGDRLVKNGINLISRYGSAECGFLLSSNRHDDNEWQFLRVPKDSKYLHFEDVQDGLAELIIKNGWPHMAKRNQPDGSYASSDLFEQHPSIERAWKYHSRKDSLIALSTGKKFDPEPLERSIIAVSDSIRDVLVFGSGKSYPGAIIFTEINEQVDDEAVLDTLWPEIDLVNRANPPHARLQRSALTIQRVSQVSKCLPKSSKGTILRGQAEKQYQKLIEIAYNGKGHNGALGVESVSHPPLSSSAIHKIVAESVHSVLGRPVEDDANLSREGLKSQQATEIRSILSTRLLQTQPWLRDKISLTVAYDQETINGLSRYFGLCLRNELASDNKGQGNEKIELQEMMRFMETRISTAYLTSVSPEPKEAIILTGATGTLGVHLLDKLRFSLPQRKIYCLVRSQKGDVSSESSPRTYLSRSLEAKKKAPLSMSDNVVVVSCEADKPQCGLDREVYSEMAATVSCIVHAAWDVNFAKPLRTFEDQFTWLISLLQLAHQATFAGQKRVSFHFCSSIASVGQIPEPSDSEKLSMSPQDATSIGYSRSKWVAEQICRNACEDSNLVYEGLDIHVLRIGQLCGDAIDGIWSKREAIPMLLSTNDIVGCLPRQNSEVDWLPVDTAAQSVLEIIASTDGNKEREKFQPLNSSASETSSNIKAVPFYLYHVVNPQPGPAWNQMLEWISEDKGSKFQVVDGRVWFHRIAQTLQHPEVKHPSKPLLPLWSQAYGQDNAEAIQSKTFESARARSSSPTLSRALKEPVITRNLIRKIGKWIDHEMANTSSAFNSRTNT